MKKVAATVLLALLGSFAQVWAKGPTSLLNTDGYTARTVQKAIAGARERLVNPECSEVLTDFADAEGRSLQEALEEIGVSVVEYTNFVFFYDGSRTKVCRGSSAPPFFTEPGSRVVYVCADRLRRDLQKDRRLADAYVIHEMLHTLGLEENPPSAGEITARVLARCYGNSSSSLAAAGGE